MTRIMTANFSERVLASEARLFACALVLLVLPLLIWGPLATQDGPAHVYNAQLMLELWQSPSPEFARWIGFSERFDPTWPFHFMLVGLLQLFGPGWAETICQVFAVIAVYHWVPVTRCAPSPAMPGPGPGWPCHSPITTPFTWVSMATA